MRMLREFQNQTALMGNKQEVLDETLETAFETDGETNATDEALTAVFVEAGLDTSLGLARLGVAGKADQTPPEDDMEARLQRLR